MDIIRTVIELIAFALFVASICIPIMILYRVGKFFDVLDSDRTNYTEIMCGLALSVIFIFLEVRGHFWKWDHSMWQFWSYRVNPLKYDYIAFGKQVAADKRHNMLLIVLLPIAIAGLKQIIVLFRRGFIAAIRSACVGLIMFVMAIYVGFFYGSLIGYTLGQLWWLFAGIFLLFGLASGGGRVRAIIVTKD